MRKTIQRKKGRGLMAEVGLRARVLALEWALKDLLSHHDNTYAMTAPDAPCGCLRMLAHASVRRAREVLGVDACNEIGTVRVRAGDRRRDE